MGLFACMLLAACGDRLEVALPPPTFVASPVEFLRVPLRLQNPDPPKPRAQRREGRRNAEPTVYGSGACGGDLPGCDIMRCESGGNLHAHNPSGADGKWQFTRWDGYGGFPSASSAPEVVQDAKAREMWAGGAGRRNWVC